MMPMPIKIAIPINVHVVPAALQNTQFPECSQKATHQDNETSRYIAAHFMTTSAIAAKYTADADTVGVSAGERTRDPTAIVSAKRLSSFSWRHWIQSEGLTSRL